MRSFIYKALIITFIFIIAFEFTIGKRLDPIVQNINKFSNEQGRKELINKLRKEMRKGLNKEYILKEDDRILINRFINKLSNEISSAENN
mgnify:FL=1|tara:strand:- start:74 stop:343 length:270 start_codon:yes stop_codon:yes gene_type:complete